MTATNCPDRNRDGEQCQLPENHPGYHLAVNVSQWVGGPMNRDGSRPEATQ